MRGSIVRKSFAKTSLVALLFFLPLACSAPENNKEQTSFSILKEAALKKDAQSFCQNISKRSRLYLRPSCREALPSLWREINKLFQDTSFVRQTDKVVFIRKKGLVLSYPVYKEEGRLKADIIGEAGWKKLP